MIVSSLSPHNLNLLFCFVISILGLIWLVLLALFFFSTVWRDSVSLLGFSFLSYVHVFPWDMSLVSSLKRSYSCLCPNLFLVIVVPLVLVSLVLVLVAVICLPPNFSILSSSRCIDVSTQSSMQASPLRPSLLDTYILSTSSLGCNSLCMVISFLVLWSICLSSS